MRFLYILILMLCMPIFAMAEILPRTIYAVSPKPLTSETIRINEYISLYAIGDDAYAHQDIGIKSHEEIKVKIIEYIEPKRGKRDGYYKIEYNYGDIAIMGKMKVSTPKDYKDILKNTGISIVGHALKFPGFSQAIALMPALNGYGTLTEDSSSGASDAVDTAAETFVTDGLSKVLKINNICDSEHLEDCGIVDKFTNFAGSVVESFPKTLKELNILFTEDISTPAVPGVIFKNPQANINTKVAAFETANGESVAVFYNPQCQPAMSENSAYYVMPKMCANFIYDLNGNKGPNTVGKDIGFMSILYPTDSFVVAPVVLSRSSNVMDKDAAVSYCRNLDSESRLPTTYELMSMVYNNILFGDFIDGSVWSSSVLSSEKAWRQSFKTGQASPAIINEQYFVFCVKRN